MQKGLEYIGVGSGAIIQNAEGKYFLSKRGKKAKNERGTWEFPGGGVEFGDTMEQTIIREFKEEYGADIEVIQLFDAYDHLIPDEKQHWIAISFICEIVNGTPQILEPEKCDAIGWYSFAEMEKMPLSLATQYEVMKLKNQG